MEEEGGGGGLRRSEEGEHVDEKENEHEDEDEDGVSGHWDGFLQSDSLSIEGDSTIRQICH